MAMAVRSACPASPGWVRPSAWPYPSTSPIRGGKPPWRKPPMPRESPDMPTALVVDDDPDIRGVVEYMLVQAGFEVYVESEGEAGFVRARDLRPDVVLLDWMMPGMTGVEVCMAL